jgi:hypothetical protein
MERERESVRDGERKEKKKGVEAKGDKSFKIQTNLEI